MATADDRNRIRELEQERDELRNKVLRLELFLNTQKKGIQWLGGLSVFVFLGPNLTTAIHNYLLENVETGESTLETKAALASAIIRRIIYVGLVGFLAIILPALLLVWQNIELKEQTNVLIDQMEMERQVQFTQTLFGSQRQRQEIVLTYISQKKSDNQTHVNLTGVDLNNIDLSYADLIGVWLRKGNLNGATFEHANLDGADLSYSMSVDANYKNASLINSNFHGSDLSMSAFVGANLENADFSNTRIFHVNFTGANLKGAKFENACFDANQSQDEGESAVIDPNPLWPEGFDTSNHKILDNCDLYKHVYFQ